ncbi:hypothetical protein MBLNU230_g0993t1 [Neophaeotheca triangularis]
MDHSTAILERVGDAIEAGAKEATEQMDRTGDQTETAANNDSDTRQGSDRADDGKRGKRKRDFPDHSIRQGGRGRNDNKRHKKGDMGRREYFRDQPDKRDKEGQGRERQSRNNEKANYATHFSQEEIAAEERKPKRKVAVMIGYSGTGYKGMQITPTEKTIEGDLFMAFVKAGAISKANADDPKKASLVRCARTDKGVHAAGNMISLKLIVEDDDVVEKINSHLSPQIRVWGIERTIGSFSCYQACDSRWYEYLIPSHAFLPPHPSSWLAKKLEELADEAGDREGFESRQQEVKGFWETVDDGEVKKIIQGLDEDIRFDVIKALQGEEEASAKSAKADADIEQPVKGGASIANQGKEEGEDQEKTADAAIVVNEPAGKDKKEQAHEHEKDASTSGADAAVAPREETAAEVSAQVDAVEEKNEATGTKTDKPASEISPTERERLQRLRAATKELRAAYNTAKRQYRIPSERIERIQAALNKYKGTRNYHNYTIQKTFADPSSKRNIKSFVVNPKPILIGDDNVPDSEKSEWLSLKVHGQSFMMHQIRKMVGMISLLVRCGSDIDKTMDQSFTEARFSIPKVPGLGLLLERPVFDSYNKFQAEKHDRAKLNFGKYEEELEAFKQREIYARIFREEEQGGEFGRFFNHIDHFREKWFLWVSSKGVEATKGEGSGEGKMVEESEGEAGSGRED